MNWRLRTYKLLQLSHSASSMQHSCSLRPCAFV